MKKINYYRWLYFIFLLAFILLFSITSLALIPGDFGSAGGGPPDGVVDFEDLMIFAMHYGESSLVHNITKDEYYLTIQAALDDADSGDTIKVSDGNFTKCKWAFFNHYPRE